MTKLLSLAMVGAALFLASCGGGGKFHGGGSGGGGGGGGGGPSAKLEDAFGAGFATTFQKAADSDPREPADADVIAVNNAADPVAVP